MRTGLLKIFLLLALPTGLIAQQDTDIIKIIPDSVMRYQGIIKPHITDYDFNQFFLPFDIPAGDSVINDFSKSTIWLRTKLVISIGYRFNEEEYLNEHMLLPLYRQHLEDSKFNPVKYVLGMAQLSAAGYLAYRHIKKYGFLK
jgi:hypothetical protein